jgi:hypothetical protein
MSVDKKQFQLYFILLYNNAFIPAFRRQLETEVFSFTSESSDAVV